jgi:hypothetical protein
MKKMLMAVIALMMTMSVSAQFFIYLSDGTIAQVDSISTIGHKYVDLGLSVKWADCNVGANSPEEYGDYFAWGEVEPKEVYSWSSYKWCTCNGLATTLTKYNTNPSYGTVDDKTVLETADDAAAANWGGAWRIPTKEEQEELRTKCTWTWINQNGVNGYKVIGPNGNSIFLPAAGYFSDSTLNYEGSGGYYWTSMLTSESLDFAYGMYCASEVDWFGYSRSYGLSVRPVCK